MFSLDCAENTPSREHTLFENQKPQAFVEGRVEKRNFFHLQDSISSFHVSQSSTNLFERERKREREREREMKTRGHHKKSLSTPVPASESEFIEPPQSNSTDLYVSFGSTGKISVRRFERMTHQSKTNISIKNNRERTAKSRQCQKYYDLEVVERPQELQRRMRRILF